MNKDKEIDLWQGLFFSVLFMLILALLFWAMDHKSLVFALSKCAA